MGFIIMSTMPIERISVVVFLLYWGISIMVLMGVAIVVSSIASFGDVDPDDI